MAAASTASSSPVTPSTADSGPRTARRKSASASFHGRVSPASRHRATAAAACDSVSGRIVIRRTLRTRGAAARSADVFERLFVRAVETGQADADPFDDRFAELLDTTAADASPVARRIIEILEERGRKGWMRIERVPADRLDHLAAP